MLKCSDSVKCTEFIQLAPGIAITANSKVLYVACL